MLIVDPKPGPYEIDPRVAHHRATAWCHRRHLLGVWRIPARLLWPSSLACERSSVATSLPISSSPPTFGAFFRRRLLVGRLRTCGASFSLVKDSQQERRLSDSLADDLGASSAPAGRRWLYLVCHYSGFGRAEILRGVLHRHEVLGVRRISHEVLLCKLLALAT